MHIYFKIIKKLDDFTVNVEYAFNNGVLVIQGESGAGKTTLLNCISGLKDPDKGRISFGDQVVFDHTLNINTPTRLRNVGYVFQNYALFPHMTVYENIIYGIKNSPEYKDKKNRSELLSYAESIMNTFGIHHLKKKLTNNISGEKSKGWP